MSWFVVSDDVLKGDAAAGREMPANGKNRLCELLSRLSSCDDAADAAKFCKGLATRVLEA